VTATIRFYFDFISPYAYLAWTQLPALADAHGAELVAVPVLFAALLDAHGQKGPAEIESKRRYVAKDAMRNAHAIGVPFSPPETHPFNPLLALRVASAKMEPQARRALVDRLFAATWGGGLGVTDPSIVAAAATEAGLDGAQAIAEAASDDAKARVRAQTEEALRAGVFGVPTLVVEIAGRAPELFWGFDSLPHVVRFLRGEDPIDEEVVRRWARIVPSATRK
jgi:2-hydroxychromene-2-carboxylate isomerase